MPDDMREIVTVEQVQRLFLLLAIALPVLGAAIGAAWGARRGNAASAARSGLLVGLVGPANLLLWTIYNAITNRLGLDTVKNLLVNLTLFAIIGIGAGLLAARGTSKKAGTPAAPADATPKES